MVSKPKRHLSMQRWPQRGDEQCSALTFFQPHHLKNPRGPITMKQFSNGGFLLLFYNNAYTSFADSSRNPYWLSSGVLSSDGTEVLWSQPEIVIYDRIVDQRPGYPGETRFNTLSIWIRPIPYWYRVLAHNRVPNLRCSHTSCAEGLFHEPCCTHLPLGFFLRWVETVKVVPQVES